jgi:hypothetical protein
MMSAVHHASAPPTIDGDFDFGQNIDLSASSGMEREVQKLREEVAALRVSQALPRSSTQSSSGALFPVTTTQAEIMYCLKVMETRGSSGVTCNLGGATFTSETESKTIEDGVYGSIPTIWVRVLFL